MQNSDNHALPSTDNTPSSHGLVYELFRVSLKMGIKSPAAAAAVLLTFLPLNDAKGLSVNAKVKAEDGQRTDVKSQ